MTDMEQLLAVAKMYYEQGLTQQEIAEKVFLSRSHVSRMLKEARALGIVEIIIRSPFENHVSLEMSLAERFGMEKILVAYTENTGPREEFNSVCSMGASYLNSILTNRSVLAVSKGKTVAATIGAVSYTHLPGGLGHLGVQLCLAGGKLRLLLLQVGLILGQLLPQGPQLVDDALVVLHDLVDEVHAAEEVGKAGGLEQHGPVGHGAPLLLLPHLADVYKRQPLLLAPPVLLAAFASPFQSRTYSLILILD